MASPSEENRLLVFGVPSDINSSLAARKLMIHFQKTAVSGGAEVDRVTVSSTYSNAYEVYFLEDQDAVLTVLQQPLQTVDFGGKLFTCSVSGFSNERHHRRDSAYEQKHTGSYEDEERRRPQEASNAPVNIKRSITLKETELKQLEMCDFTKTVKQTFPNLAMSLRPETASMDLYGPNVEIERCKLMVLEHLRELPIARIAPPSSSAVMNFLKSPRGDSLVSEYFRKYQIRACYFVDNGDIICSGISKEETDRAKAFLAHEIVESRVNLEDKAVTVAKTTTFSEIIRRLEELNECLTIELTRHGTVVLVGKDTSVSVAMDGVQTYILSNQEIERFVPLEAGRLRFVRDMKEELLNFEQTSGRQSVKIEVQHRVDQCGVKVIGVKHEVDGAVPVLRSRFDKIVKRRHEVDNPGMQQIFKDRDKKDYLRLIEVDCNCTIEVTEERLSKSDYRKYEKPTLRKDPEHSVKILLERTTNDGRRIVVAKGDITKLQVDAIATTAKRDFGSLTGLFKTIRDAGGSEIQSECEKLLCANNGTPFVVGQAVSSRPGKLPSCSRVIHVFGPEWDKDAERSVVDSLADAIESCLSEADKHACRTVAIPLIGVDEFGFPLDLCVNTIVTTINDFWSENENRTSIAKIFLIEQLRSKCKAFADAVRSVYNVKNEVAANDEYQQEEKSQTIEIRRPRLASSIPKLPAVTKTMTYIDQTRVMTPEGKNVNLIIGNLATQKVDLLVNSIGKELDLTAGAASKAIYSVAGPQLKHELSNVTKGRPPKDGDTFVTLGANLPAKHVIHIICCHWQSTQQNQSEQTLRDILQDCFRIADAKSAKSIAFPAIGTGNLNFPRDLVAKVMYEEAEFFSRGHATSTLIDIDFVVYDQDHPTIKSFKTKVQKYASMIPVSPGSPAAEKMRRHERERAITSRSHGALASGTSDIAKTKSFKDERLYKDLDLHGHHEWQMSVGSIRVHVINGDITSETMDCVVTEVNKKLEPITDISVLIINNAGYEVQRALESFGTNHPCKAHLTTAGNLPCRKLIHAVVEDINVKTIVQQILELAHTHQMTSLAMPPICLGCSNKDTKDIAYKTFQAFGKFLENKTATYVHTVKVVTLQSRLVEVYRQAMIDIIHDQGKHSIFDKLSNWKSSSSNKPGIEEAEEAYPEREPVTRVLLDIFAESEQNIDRAVAKIKTVLSREVDTIVISKPSVKMLQREQMEKIKRFGTSRNVSVEPISTGRVHHLKLHGTPHNIIQVYDMISKILDNIVKDEQGRREAEIHAKNVKWYFQDGEEYEEYEKEISAVIEQACQRGQPEVEFDINGGIYKIIFKKMVEISLDDKSEVPVQRFLTEDAIPLPPNWEPMAQDKPFILVALDPSTSEYQNVKSAFIQKLSYTRNVVDIHIERVQNSKLYRQYMVLKQNLDARKSGVQNERNLYHGTKVKTCTLINATGFNRSFAGENAAAFGKGSYFAVKSGYSAKGLYSPPDDNGYKYIYQCKVLTGEYARGDKDMMVPPPKNPNNPTICYDSVVDTMDDPTIFVVFNDALAYPEYLIKFKEL